MSTLTVTVTAPDGRAKTTVTIPGTCLLKNIVQNACVNLKLATIIDSPEIDRYGLCHGRVTLDLSSSARLSGLPPGAKLTLVQTFTRESNILVALQHTIRVTDTFPCSASLWSILTHFNVGLTVTNGTVMAPRLVILGQEYGGLEKLIKTTLRSIGVTGSCLMRVAYKPAEVQSLQEAEAIISQPSAVSPAVSAIEQTIAGESISAVEHTITGHTIVGESISSSLQPGMQGSTSLSLQPGMQGTTSLNLQPVMQGTTSLNLQPGMQGTTSLSLQPGMQGTTDPNPQLEMEGSTEPTPQLMVALSNEPILQPGMEGSPHSNRKFALFTPPNATVLVQAPDLPDSHYELGESEFRLHLAVTHARTRALIDAPLLSRAKLVEKRQAELLSRYPVARIRFRMPDQHQLEAEFESTEAANQLYAFVRWALKTSDEFLLSIGPPPKSIKNGSTPIWQLDLVPAAIVNVAFSQGKVVNVFNDMVLSTSRPIPQLNPSPTLNSSTDLSASNLATNAPATAPSTKKPSWLRL